jgi:ABC-2 type transport system permease protein
MTVFVKSLREQYRDPLTLALTLVFAPVFVLLYWLFFPSGGSTTYTVLVINQDIGIETDGMTHLAGLEATEALQAITYANGYPILKVRHVASQVEAESLLRDRKATVYINFPADFSQSLAAAQSGDDTAPSRVVFGGDLTNPYYPIAMILATSAIESYVQQATGQSRPLQYAEEPLGGSGARTEFETYVPGLFIFAIVMLVFIASMTVAREVEAGTLHRMKITKLKSIELLGGIGLSLVIIGLIAEILALVTALALGFQSYGPLWVALLIGGVTSVAVIGVGMVVAAFSRTVAQAFIIANFPLALFMFFTGAVFPIPPVTIFDVAGRSISLYDVLPPTHAVVALNKVLTLGAGLEEVSYELTMLLILSAAYFLFGSWLFRRRHMGTS